MFEAVLILYLPAIQAMFLKCITDTDPDKFPPGSLIVNVAVIVRQEKR